MSQLVLFTVALAAETAPGKFKTEKALGTFTMPMVETFTLGKNGGAMDFAWESLPMPMFPKVLACGRNEKVENSYSSAKTPADVRECATNAIDALMRGSWNMDRGRKASADTLMRPYIDAVIAAERTSMFDGWIGPTKELKPNSNAANAFASYRKEHPAFAKASDSDVAKALLDSLRNDPTNRGYALDDYKRAMQRAKPAPLPVDPAAIEWANAT